MIRYGVALMYPDQIIALTNVQNLLHPHRDSLLLTMYIIRRYMPLLCLDVQELLKSERSPHALPEYFLAVHLSLIPPADLCWLLSKPPPLAGDAMDISYHEKIDS